MQKNIRFKIPKNALEKSAAKEVVRIAESGGKIGVACSRRGGLGMRLDVGGGRILK